MAERRIALATCAEFPSLSPDDVHLLQPLERAGMLGEPAVWDDPEVDWASFDGVVIRSTWDYHLHRDAFRSWLDRLEAAGTPVWNPLDVLRWNMDKRYLLELESRGVPIVPTAVLPRGSEPEVERMLRERGWDRVVVKPSISAGGYGAWTVDRSSAPAHRTELADLLAMGDVIVQPFVEAFFSGGETSFVFIDGAYSHAVLKRAAEGAFLVHEEYGGSVDPIEPGADLIGQAERIAAAGPPGLLYGRVDAVDVEGRLLLGELEILEPELFLRFPTGAADRLVAALRDRLP